MDTRLTKKYYKIREASDIIGVPQSTLRFWEKEFKELEPQRTTSGQRQYSQGDLETLQIINYLLRIKGMKIDSAKENLRHNRKNISRRLEIIEKLNSVRDDLEILLKSLNLRGEKIGIK